MTKAQAEDLIKRAVWTFAQAAIAFYLVTEEPFTKVALAGAIGAGLSALKTWAIATFKI